MSRLIVMLCMTWSFISHIIISDSQQYATTIYFTQQAVCRWNRFGVPAHTNQLGLSIISAVLFSTSRFVLGKYRIGDGPRNTTVRLVAKLCPLLFFTDGEGAQHNALPYSLHDGATEAHRERERPGLKNWRVGFRAPSKRRECVRNRPDDKQ